MQLLFVDQYNFTTMSIETGFIFMHQYVFVLFCLQLTIWTRTSHNHIYSCLLHL